MIVDDEEGIRAVLAALLDSIGVSTIEAPDGRTAEKLLTENQDSIVACMLDMNLEDGYGEEVYDRLRAISPSLTVFAMSGIFSDEIRDRLGDRQIAGLISKPFSAGQLIDTVTTGLKNRLDES